MWWWKSIDDTKVNREAFETATTKQAVYFLLAMSFLSGMVALVGIFQILANPNLLNQIPQPLTLAVIGILGWALFFPWFMVTYFARHALQGIRELEKETQQLRSAIEGDNY
jgi:uncharacterized membrane protein